MNAYIQLTIAQLRIFSRNRGVIFFSLFFPVLLMVALGSFLGGGSSVLLSAMILNEDATEASYALERQLNADGLIELSTGGVVLDEALEALKRGETSFVIVIPKGYETTLEEAASHVGQALRQASPVKVFYDETNLALSQLGLTVIEQAVDAVSKERLNYQPAVVVESTGVQAVQLQYIDFLVPGIVAMMIMNTNLNGVAGQISAWRERGILRRMQSTTLRPSTFISAQITARLLLNGLQAVIVLLIGSLVFGTQMNGSWLLLLFFVVLGTLTFMSIGFIIAGVAKNPETAGPIAGLISFPLLFLGGIFFPIKNMPEWLQPLVHVIPITHLSTALRQVMNLGADFGTLWNEALLLGGWMTAAFVIASFVFKWE